MLNSPVIFFLFVAGIAFGSDIKLPSLNSRLDLARNCAQFCALKFKDKIHNNKSKKRIYLSRVAAVESRGGNREEASVRRGR